MATKKATSTKKTVKPRARTSAATTTRATRVSNGSETVWQSAHRMFTTGNLPFGAVVAEFVAGFAFAGAVIAGSGQPIIILFALAAIVLFAAPISGGHVNPAVSIAAWITRQITWTRALAYVIAQLLGAMLAYVVLNWFFKGTVDTATAALSGQSTVLFHVNALTQGKEWYAFWGELFGAALFGFGAGAALIKRGSYTGAYTMAGAMFIGLLIGGSTAILNPALAVALQAFDFSKAVWWPLMVWVVATVVGMTLGMGLFRLARPSLNNRAE